MQLIEKDIIEKYKKLKMHQEEVGKMLLDDIICKNTTGENNRRQEYTEITDGINHIEKSIIGFYEQYIADKDLPF